MKTDSFKRTEENIMINTRSIISVVGFLEYVQYICKYWKTGDLWFRGESDLSNKLYPGIMRGRNWDIYREELNYDEFVQKAPTFTVNRNTTYWDWEWYHLMQHYGAPTRLLDWTMGSLIALYFAVRDVRRGNIPVVWIIDPYWLNKVNGVKEAILNDYNIDGSLIYTSDYTDKIMGLYLKFDAIPEYPAATNSAYIDMRVHAQRGCFTIHGKKKDGFYELAANEKHPRIIKLKLRPHDHRSAIKEDLARNGISESTLFPGLEGLSSELRWKYG
ncbi:MAG: FRG domain-containing protein [Candidatus Hatepunaea meridiana]|nr:FRG domain-containing protein [Candidatus Hatepunaea meridiana]